MTFGEGDRNVAAPAGAAAISRWREELEALGTLLPTEDNGVCLMTAVSYAPRATDERVTCLRIYADVDGETHLGLH
jgi:hypothetical protein